ncbi:MAG: hypothetical protein J1E56_07635 [Ruminococcus sp.]|nr:hypothetical protein [Ruminococcus sp.]
MLILKLDENKVLHPDKKSNNYTGENNFEKIRIISSPTFSDRNLTDLNVELYIYNIINDERSIFNDCVPCKFKEENGELIFEIPIKGQYTVFPQLGMYLKFTDQSGTVGKTNVVKTMILYHKDNTIDTSNSITLFEKYKKEIEKASLKAPYIGEDGFWYVYMNGEYIRTDFPAQSEKGDKGDKGDNYILTEADKKEIAGMVCNSDKSNVKLLADITLEEPVNSVTITTDSEGNPLDLSEIIIYIDSIGAAWETDPTTWISYAVYGIKINRTRITSVSSLAADNPPDPSKRKLITGHYNGYGWMFDIVAETGNNIGSVQHTATDIAKLDRANEITVCMIDGDKLLSEGTHIKIYGG